MPADLHVPCAVDILVVFKRHFLLRLCKVEAGFWFLYFYQVLECAFPEIEELCIMLPNDALHSSAFSILSPGPPLLQVCIDSATSSQR